MITLASGLSYLDLDFYQTKGIIASAILHGPGGAAIIDPGPSSTLPALRAELEQAGIALADVRDILLTHIHLDHAGCTGTLVRENPALRVHVHEKGAPHMIDPSKLMASATRLWGHEMDRLWGDMRPVPAENLAVLRGGERIAERHGWRIGLTPERLTGFDDFFQRHGAKTVFAARFITGLRVVGAVLAGGSGMKWPVFLFYNATGAVVWCTTIACAGYSLAYSWGTLERWIGGSGLAALALVAVLGVIALVRARRNHHP